MTTYSTNFNQSPYWDDYDETKDFHGILFRPSVAIQTRELNQLQSILRNQVAKFGSNILQEGSIISGCDFTELRNRFKYVKILDDSTDGIPVSLTSYVDAKVVGATSGVEARVIKIATGLESQTPDLNTLYVKYTKSGSSNEKEFTSTENLEIRNWTTDALIKTVTVGGTADGSPTGDTYGTKINDGWIFQKGSFIRVDEQTTIVVKYSNSPDGIVVGFETTETLIDENSDTSLYDNAAGAPNENAPGAHRLKLTATLTSKTLAEAEADETFFAIQEYVNSKVSMRNGTTTFNSVANAMAKRTYEESGDYTVRPFGVRVAEHASNTSLLNVFAAPGLAYVNGRRIELVGETKYDLPKASTSNTETQQNIITNYGHYVIVDEMMGGFDFQQPNEITLHDTAQNRFTAGSVGSLPSGQIGTAKIRSLAHHSGTPGANTAQYRLYLFDVLMTSNTRFEDTRTFFYNGASANGSADPVLESNNAVIKEFSFKKMIFPIGREAIKTVPTANTDYVFRTYDDTLTCSTGGAITITLSGNDQWPYTANVAMNATQKSEIILISDETQAPYTIGETIDLASATVTPTSSQVLTITGLSAPAAEMDIIACFNVKKTQAAPAGKDLDTIYVKVAANTNVANTTGNYGLGVPDVFSIEGAYQTSNGTYTESGTDVTSSFKLVTNQKDTFYDLSKVRKKRSLTIGADDTILFKLKAFKKDTSGSYSEGFFSVDSYPVDDANTANTAAITTQEIPSYKADDGVLYYLRDTIDFRPYAANTATYSATIGSATVDPNTAVTFGSSAIFIPAPNEAFETNYDYYLGRKDHFLIDGDGRFVVVDGEPDETPAPPSAPSTGMVLATLDIPPYPSLPKRVADAAGKPDYGVRFSTTSQRRYTMRDIGQIDKRLSSMEYYAALNMLEQETLDKPITDSDGIDRFKNGIFVDNFKDLSIADVNNSEFNAGIDQNSQEITPKFRMYPIELEASNTAWTDVTNFGDVATLSKTDASLIDQPYATKTRSCTSNFYLWNASIFLSPEFDMSYDVTRAPDVNVEIDLSDAFTEFVDVLSDYIPMTREAQDVTVARIADGSTTTTITTTTSTSSTLGVTGTEVNDVSLGNFVTDVRFNPYVAGKRVEIKAYGLRPSTEYHFFFDGVDVDAHVSPGALNPNTSANREVVRSGAFGNTVSSDTAGNLYAIFKIPEGTFYVGERILEIMDVTTYTSKDSASSSGSARYVAYNMGLSQTDVSISTRTPTYGTNFDVSSDVAVQVVTQNDDRGPEGNSVDPLAQTFTIKTGMSKDKVIFVPKIDLFFSSKSSTRGATVSIIETVNGYPSARKVPFGEVHIASADINANSSYANTATTVTFNSPVALTTGHEYAVMVLPDGNDPDYRMWIAKTGELDVDSGLNITQDANPGVLFTSTNGSAWHSYQDENLKFKLYKCEFSATDGYAYLTNKNNEFFTVSSITGTFTTGEQAVANTANATGTIAIVVGNNTITGTSTTFDTDFAIGEYITARPTSNTVAIYKITNIASNTSLTIEDSPLSANTTANYFAGPVGRIAYLNSNSPARLILNDSSAKTGLVFSANDVIIGEVSNAYCTVDSVDDQNISYFQPDIRYVDFTKTKTTAKGKKLHNGTTTYEAPISLNANKYLNKQETAIKSRSNEITEDAGAKSFEIEMRLRNNGNNTDASPLLDHAISTINAYEYIINNDSSDELTDEGAATSKYVSRTVELAAGLEADDIKVYVDAYKPPLSDIEVYVRVKHATDPRPIEEVEWTILQRKGETDFTSSNANRYDYKEFEYYLDTTALGNGAGAYLNNDIIRYTDPDGIIYDTYKHFQIKIVMLSSSHRQVPRLKNMRTIALSA